MLEDGTGAREDSKDAPLVVPHRTVWYRSVEFPSPFLSLSLSLFSTINTTS